MTIPARRGVFLLKIATKEALFDDEREGEMRQMAAIIARPKRRLDGFWRWVVPLFDSANLGTFREEAVY